MKVRRRRICRPWGQTISRTQSTTAQINDVLNRMATDDLAKQLSCSYGFDINLSTVQIFQQFAAQGQSFFLASGDSGAFSSAVNEPADDPYVTVVGGTTLTETSDGTWASETAWLTPRLERSAGWFHTRSKHRAEASAWPMASRPGNRASA